MTYSQTVRKPHHVVGISKLIKACGAAILSVDEASRTIEYDADEEARIRIDIGLARYFPPHCACTPQEEVIEQAEAA
jgi:hypothetical protein